MEESETNNDVTSEVPPSMLVKRIPEEKKKEFMHQLRLAIKAEMTFSPRKFSKVALNDELYSDKFAEHLVAKFESGSVIAINETVREAAYNLGVMADDSSLRQGDLLAVYEYLEIDPPGGDADRENRRPPPPPRMKGC